MTRNKDISRGKFPSAPVHPLQARDSSTQRGGIGASGRVTGLAGVWLARRGPSDAMARVGGAPPLDDSLLGTASEQCGTSGVLCEFLEAAVHTAVKVRGVYPPELFERRRLYNVVTYKARHPGLNEYIHETVHSLNPWIRSGALEKLVLVFIDAKDRPVERLVFHVKVRPSHDARSADAPKQQRRSQFPKLVLTPLTAADA